MNQLSHTRPWDPTDPEVEVVDDLDTTDDADGVRAGARPKSRQV